MIGRSSVRTIVYRAELWLQAARFARLDAPPHGWPILLGISFPKSGTHLLDQILLGFSRFAPFARRLHSFYAEFEGESGRSRSPDQARAWLNSLRPRDVASAHLFARPAAVQRVTEGDVVPFFIYRDPRDVVVSHVFYVTEMETRHVHHAYYASLPDFDSRLRVSILGRPDLDIDFPNIADRFAPYTGWLECPDVMKIHFEDLATDRRRVLDAILDRFLQRVPLELERRAALDALESAINPERSPTFRSGRTGDWKKHFTPEIKALFKSVTGDLLQRLGYESGPDW